MSGAFSLGGQKDNKKTTKSYEESPLFSDTGYSSFSGGKFTLDPTIRAMQDKAYQDYASIYGDVGSGTERYLKNIGSIRDKYLGNAGDYMKASVDPILQQGALASGQAQRSLGQRGLGGSSFFGQTMSNIARDTGEAAGRAGALATAQMAEFEKGLSDSELSALNNQAQMRAKLTGESLEVAKQRLAMEMGIFNIGKKGTGTEHTKGTSYGFGAILSSGGGGGSGVGSG